MTTITKAMSRWAESASLSRLFYTLKDHAHPARNAALYELGERMAHIALDALLIYHESGYQPASPLASMGTGSVSTGGNPLNQMELAAIHHRNQDQATRLALDLLTWIRPKQAVSLLFATWVARKGLKVAPSLNSHWDTAIADLQLRRWFTPSQLKKPNYSTQVNRTSKASLGIKTALLHITDPSRNPAPPKAAGRIARD